MDSMPNKQAFGFPVPPFINGQNDHVKLTNHTFTLSVLYSRDAKNVASISIHAYRKHIPLDKFLLAISSGTLQLMAN